MQQLLLESLRTKYISQKTQALAELSLFLNNPNISPDHTSIVSEMDNRIKQIAFTQTKLQILQQVAEENLPHLSKEEQNESK